MMQIDRNKSEVRDDISSKSGYQICNMRDTGYRTNPETED